MNKYSKEFTNSKTNKKFLITYEGDIELEKDGFIVMFTGYDDAIGNKICDYKHFGQFKEVMKKSSLENLLDNECKKYEKPHFTSGFSYMNVIDIVNMYGKYISEGYTIDYNDRINKWGFKITEI